MFDPNQPHPSRPDIVSRKIVILRGQDEEGAIGTEETMGLVNGALVKKSLTVLARCGGCQAAIHEPKEMGSSCSVCGKLLCGPCSAIKCSECGQSVCSSDRIQFGATIFCVPCFKRRALGGLAAVVILAILSLLLVLLVKTS